MSLKLPVQVIERLWTYTIRPDSRQHRVPVWLGGIERTSSFFISTAPKTCRYHTSVDQPEAQLHEWIRDHGVLDPGGLRISAVRPERNVTHLQHACKLMLLPCDVWVLAWL
jgi:hypothetical protein